MFLIGSSRLAKQSLTLEIGLLEASDDLVLSSRRV
jgi:hypothetical protein